MQLLMIIVTVLNVLYGVIYFYDVRTWLICRKRYLFKLFICYSLILAYSVLCLSIRAGYVTKMTYK